MKDVQQRIVKIRNEVKAQKVFSGLAFSQLLLPDNTPTKSYSGTASLSGSGTTPVARLRFRFTRTDGRIEPPMINFAYNASYSPSYKTFAESNGFTFSAYDLTYIMHSDIVGYIGEIGDGYVDYYIDYNSSIRGRLFSLNSVSISAECQAIVAVKGTLVVERLI